MLMLSGDSAVKQYHVQLEKEQLEVSDFPEEEVEGDQEPNVEIEDDSCPDE